jgi:hypothetical protein
MKFSKAKQTQQEAPAVEPSLADQLTAACAAAEKYIASIAAREKGASPLQPLAWHEMNIRLMHGRCACKCALALMEKENAQ